MGRIRFGRNFKFRDVTKAIGNDRMMREAGEMLAMRIENRTLSGVDENRRSFIPYTDAYARRKGERTVTLHGPQSRMFRDFGVVEVGPKRFGLGFRTRLSELKGLVHDQGLGTQPKRPWAGVPAAWVTELLQFIRARIRIR